MTLLLTQNFYLEDGSIDFTITQNLYRQGYLPIIYLKEYLKNDTLPDSTNITPHISIISDRVPRL